MGSARSALTLRKSCNDFSPPLKASIFVEPDWMMVAQLCPNHGGGVIALLSITVMRVDWLGLRGRIWIQFVLSAQLEITGVVSLEQL